MTDELRDKLIDKIRKLLALSTSANEHEAALAAEKAQALLAEYNLSMTDIVTDEEGKDEGFIIDGEMVDDDPYPWKRQLCQAVSKLYFCKYFFVRIRGVGIRNSIVGAPHNIAVAKMMYQYLADTTERLAREARKKQPPELRKGYRRSFMIGCALRLCERIQKRIDDSKKSGIVSDGKNLPALLDLYNKAENQLTVFMNKEIGQLKTSKRRLRYSNSNGLRDGTVAGDQIGLDSQVGSKKADPKLGRRSDNLLGHQK